jgi:putative transposase
MIRRLQQRMKEDGFEVPRRTMYYRPIKSAPKVQERVAAPIKQLIEADPSFGYRSVAGLLQFNTNTVQRIFQSNGWQVRKRAAWLRFWSALRA